ncbi:hypothetical protein [Clostridium sp.]|uniref:hypothetical protein n=1 Tax=Clostridium sp. TaxID=1506 RepID=UPI001A3B8F3F|nr:hypothetical protein [Clostridium sp.]MBK5243052.1 hypothetical protein [Clostridium sp.]
MDPVKLEVILLALATDKKPIKVFNFRDKITAIGEDGPYWIIEIDVQKAYVEKGRTIKI